MLMMGQNVCTSAVAARILTPYRVTGQTVVPVNSKESVDSGEYACKQRSHIEYIFSGENTSSNNVVKS